MDQESQKRLDAIVAAGPDSITEADAGFLRARSSYLDEEARATFAAVLEVGTQPDGASAPASKYDELSMSELRRLVQDRELSPAGGKKADLIATLVAADAVPQ